MPITEDQAEAFAASTADIAIFFRLATDEKVRLWGGSGDFPVPSDAIEPGGATYKGVGTLEGIPELSALVNGVAERVTVGLSGVDATIAALADSEAAEVRGKTVNIGILPLDSELQVIGTVLWLRSYEADVLVIEGAGDNAGKSSRRVMLSVGSPFTARRRPPIAFFTNADQMRRSADDRFCERTPLYSQGTLKTWPRF